VQSMPEGLILMKLAYRRADWQSKTALGQSRRLAEGEHRGLAHQADWSMLRVMHRIALLSIFWRS